MLTIHETISSPLRRSAAENFINELRTANVSVIPLCVGRTVIMRTLEVIAENGTFDCTEVTSLTPRRTVRMNGRLQLFTTTHLLEDENAEMQVIVNSCGEYVLHGKPTLLITPLY